MLRNSRKNLNCKEKSGKRFLKSEADVNLKSKNFSPHKELKFIIKIIVLLTSSTILCICYYLIASSNMTNYEGDNKIKNFEGYNSLNETYLTSESKLESLVTEMESGDEYLEEALDYFEDDLSQDFYSQMDSEELSYELEDFFGDANEPTSIGQVI